jgi:hypothetical protein
MRNRKCIDVVSFYSDTSFFTSARKKKVFAADLRMPLSIYYLYKIVFLSFLFFVKKFTSILVINERKRKKWLFKSFLEMQIPFINFFPGSHAVANGVHCNYGSNRGLQHAVRKMHVARQECWSGEHHFHRSKIFIIGIFEVFVNKLAIIINIIIE